MLGVTLSRPARIAAIGLFVAVMLWHWLAGVTQQSTMNEDIRLTDQDAYIEFARSVKESDAPGNDARFAPPAVANRPQAQVWIRG